MKVKCQNIVSCGNYQCCFNSYSFCVHTVVSLNAEGKCALFKQNPSKIKDKPTQNPNKDLIEDAPASLSKLVPPLD